MEEIWITAQHYKAISLDPTFPIIKKIRDRTAAMIDKYYKIEAAA